MTPTWFFISFSTTNSTMSYWVATNLQLPDHVGLILNALVKYSDVVVGGGGMIYDLVDFVGGFSLIIIIYV